MAYSHASKKDTIGDIRKCWADQDYILGPGHNKPLTHLLVQGLAVLQTGSDLGEKTPSSEPQLRGRKTVSPPHRHAAKILPTKAPNEGLNLVQKAWRLRAVTMMT